MGLFDFFKPRPSNNFNRIIPEMGFTVYQYCMVNLSHCMIELALGEGEFSETRLNAAVKIQASFSYNVAGMEINSQEAKHILWDMKSEIEQMMEDEIDYHHTKMARDIPKVLSLEIREQIMIHLAMFHIIDELSSRNQAMGLGFFSEIYSIDNGESNVNRLLSKAMKNINLMN